MRSFFEDIWNNLMTSVRSAGLVALFFLAFMVVPWAVMSLIRLVLG